ncbi:SOS response-associated peptidase family protein [Rugamonas sp. A1-17]|nr:SOS response-associated peptidase family protein [Rugamonas sp. A1-17]
MHVQYIANFCGWYTNRLLLCGDDAAQPRKMSQTSLRDIDMCGRLDQNDINRLLENFDWVEEVINRSTAEGRFNVSPGTVRPVIHVTDQGLVMDDLFWGYRSPWAEATGTVPIASNAKFEKVKGSYWKPLLKRGRAIAPAAGWYEWTGEKPHKQPWHIHRADGKPLYLAALASFESKGDYKGATGFALVTSEAEGGLLDIHDRRPLVLSAQDAMTWLDPAIPPEEAAEFLRVAALPPDAFSWYQVDRAVGNVRNQGAHLAAPLES